MPSSLTVHKKGSKQVCVQPSGGKKTVVTVTLSCSADGRKLLPYVAFNSKKMLKGEELLKNVVVSCQEKGWMDEGLVLG